NDTDFLPLKLCQACGEEYRLYQQISSSATPVEGQEYYHNQDWVSVWKTWLEYQVHLQRYRNSKEFLRLVGELSREE
ncbi:MAG: hypothetical protein C0407_19380, partial [Desulfobacca sp.]|nr:hypothetical protein [Desulfobacca sp.]